MACFWEVGQNQRTQRNPRGHEKNIIQNLCKDINPSSGLNEKPKEFWGGDATCYITVLPKYWIIISKISFEMCLHFLKEPVHTNNTMYAQKVYLTTKCMLCSTHNPFYKSKSCKIVCICTSFRFRPVSNLLKFMIYRIWTRWCFSVCPWSGLHWIWSLSWECCVWMCE